MGKQWKQCQTLFFGAPKSLQMVIAGVLGSIPGLGRSPAEEMKTSSSVLAWEFPWIEEPGRQQSMVLQRVRHD